MTRSVPLGAYSTGFAAHTTTSNTTHRTNHTSTKINNSHQSHQHHPLENTSTIPIEPGKIDRETFGGPPQEPEGA